MRLSSLTHGSKCQLPFSPMRKRIFGLIEVVHLEELVVLEAARHRDGALDRVPIVAALVDRPLDDGDLRCSARDLVAACRRDADAEGELEVEHLGEVDLADDRRFEVPDPAVLAGRVREEGAPFEGHPEVEAEAVGDPNPGVGDDRVVRDPRRVDDGRSGDSGSGPGGDDAGNRRLAGGAHDAVDAEVEDLPVVARIGVGVRARGGSTSLRSHQKRPHRKRSRRSAVLPAGASAAWAPAHAHHGRGGKRHPHKQVHPQSPHHASPGSHFLIRFANGVLEKPADREPFPDGASPTRDAPAPLSPVPGFL